MSLIPVTNSISIDADEIEESFARSSGPGGQSVNTTDSAVMLRFNIAASPNLPAAVKSRLRVIGGTRVTRDGVLILRSERARSQLLNREEVRERLIDLIREATVVPKKRRPTKPSRTAKAKRVDAKKKRGNVKAARGRVEL